MSWQSNRQKHMRYVAAGIEFIVTFALPLTGGLLLDVYLNSLPGFTILGAVIGFAVGVHRLARKGREIIRGQRHEEQEPPDEAG